LEIIQPKEYTLNAGCGVDRGYIRFYDPEHPLSNKNGLTCLHRHVASTSLGRWLKTDEDVHHVNGDRSDNCPENLIVLSHAEHARLHKPNTRPVISCESCGEGTTNKKYCSPLCSSFASRKVKNRPYKDVLEQDLSKMSWCAVGRKYGVSDNAVRKWARSYSLI